jgi:hypothetical protein
MSSDWTRKRGRDGEQKGSDEAPPEGGGESDRQHQQPRQAPPQGHPPVPIGGPQRYPPGARAPEGYYQPVYPPPPGEGSAAYPPPRGYEGPPYGMPPHMAGYPPPMYPYPPPMYPPYPGYPAPPQMNPYGYPPPDPNMPGGHHPAGPPPPRGYPGEEGANVGPYGQAHPAVATASRRRSEEDEDRKPAARSEGSSTGGDEDESTEAHSEAGPIVPGAVTARLKTYIKPRLPSTQDVVDRRSRKNSQSRARATKLRGRIGEIELKPEPARDEEESLIWSQYEQRRQRKNDRSRERAMERKEEIDRILAKPEKKRTKIEKSFLDTALYSKKRKNEGDRVRRQRLKDMGIPTKGPGMKPGINVQLPMAHHGYHHGPPHHGYGGHMGEIPMSPMPSMAMAHPHPYATQSPGAYGSPGMMAGMFPSPQQYARRPAAAAPGAVETPGRQRAEQGGAPLPFIPPAQAYDAHAASPAEHMHHHHSNRVAQRSNPDGSMSISIGANGAEGSSFDGESRLPGAEEPSSMNISDVSHLLLYNDGEGEGGEQQESNGEEKEADEEEEEE